MQHVQLSEAGEAHWPKVSHQNNKENVISSQAFMQHIPTRIQVFKRRETYEGRKKMLCGMWMRTSKNEYK